mmetsp:Transcript_51359/g.164947  ORF Transcript_51359/g.164947 Transcript_51359/m.164947 type:complete len:264 (+) Transcript_51359:371-1162(+)
MQSIQCACMLPWKAQLRAGRLASLSVEGVSRRSRWRECRVAHDGGSLVVGVLRELPLLQVAVHPGLAREQGLVRAHFGNGSIFQHDDDVRGANRRQAVGDHDVRAAGALRHERVQGVLHNTLGLGIQRRRRFVQEQDCRVGHQGTRDGDALLLAAGELNAALADHCRILLREGANEVVAIRLPGGLLHSAVRDLVAHAEADVLTNRRGEQYGFLRHDCDVLPQICMRQLPHVVAIYPHRSALAVVQPLEKRNARRLPASRWAH